MVNIKDRLPNWFTKSENTLLNDIITVIQQAIEELYADTDKAIDSLIIQNSESEFLDYWGKWFGLPRYTGESDLQYATRLLAEIKYPKQTIPALKKYIADVLNVSELDITIYEPYTNILILSERGELSGDERLTDDIYWNWTIIDILAPYQYDKYVENIIKKVKAGGIKALWSFLIQPYLNFNSNTDTAFTKEYNALLDFYEILELSSDYGWFSVVGELSHVKIVDSDYIQIFMEELSNVNISSVASILNIYSIGGYGVAGYGTSYYGSVYPDSLTNYSNSYGTQPFGTSWYGGYTE